MAARRRTKSVDPDKKRSKAPKPKLSEFGRSTVNDPVCTGFARILPWIAAFLPAIVVWVHFRPLASLAGHHVVEVAELVGFGSWGLLLVYCTFMAEFMPADRLGRALSFMIGPSLSIMVPLALLLKMAKPMMQTPDKSWIDIEKHPEHQEYACMSALGYVNNLSGLAGNLSSEYYVFLYLTLTLFPLVWLAYLPPVTVIRPPRMDELQSMLQSEKGPASQSQSRWYWLPPEDSLGSAEFLCQQWLIRLGLAALVYTGAVPYWFEGKNQSAQFYWLLIDLHCGGMEVGILAGGTGITWYLLRAMYIKGRKHPERTVPHALVLATLLVALEFLAFFFEMKALVPPVRAYHDVCFLRSPHAGCQLPPSFNATAHAAAHAIEGVGAVKCVPSGDGAVCVEPGCAYTLRALSYATEVAGIALIGVAIQGFVCLMFFDADIHPPLPESRSLDGKETDDRR